MKTMKKQFALAFLLLSLMVSFSGASGQTIQGKIIDLVSEQPVQSVTVSVFNENGEPIDSVKSNRSGAWEFTFPQSSVDLERQVIGSFHLSQNYPNPFNPATQIDFSLPGNSKVSLEVFNILGEKVASHSAMLAPGNYSVIWQCAHSAGVYFYRIRTNFGSLTKKMIQLEDGGSGKFARIRFSGNKNGTLPKSQMTRTVSIVFSRFDYCADTIFSEIQGGEFFETKLETFHNRSILVDLHNDILEKMLEDSYYHLADFHNYNHTDIPRMKLGGVDLQFFAVWVSPTRYEGNYFNTAKTMLDIFDAEIGLNSDDIAQARTASEVRAIVGEGKIAAVIGVEGGHTIENKIENLISLYERGMRYMTITWNNSTDWAISAKDSRSRTVGLSDFGRKVIRKMDSLGVIIDVSHTGIKTIEDILAITKNPIVATHSGARALRDHYRNLYDDQIIAIANTGGVIGVVFYPPYLSPNGYANISTVVNHIDYIANLVGVDYVALGSDFDGIGTNTVHGLEDISKYPDLTQKLLLRGYSREDVKKILGGNFLWVFEEVCGE